MSVAMVIQCTIHLLQSKRDLISCSFNSCSITSIVNQFRFSWQTSLYVLRFFHFRIPIMSENSLCTGCQHNMYLKTFQMYMYIVQQLDIHSKDWGRWNSPCSPKVGQFT
ncbi:unnamed protein product [Owenia fusiformis]|uniref:Uncharacterized protein n=1 Tax=Owenia fusiformis TaxID=6347 RepID=A0A8S4PT40_OWEFU|nr:unnamed protein product [Owenia fusiformis]